MPVTVIFQTIKDDEVMYCWSAAVLFLVHNNTRAYAFICMRDIRTVRQYKIKAVPIHI